MKSNWSGRVINSLEKMSDEEFEERFCGNEEDVPRSWDE
jgi:hypothetical protein